MNENQIKQILDKNKEDSTYIEEIVNSLVFSCCDKLDNYVEYVATQLQNNAVLTNAELDDIVMSIPILLYYVGTQQERLGIKQDVSQSTRNMIYQQKYAETAGTAGLKDSVAKSFVANEDLVIVVFARAYNIIKSKVSLATEMLQSAKKIMSRRMAEAELSKVTPNKDRKV